MRLYDIDQPDKIRKCTVDELYDLAEDIRTMIIQTVSKNGGHLAKNLSVVELSIALHCVFDIPKDKLIFDGGQSCYAHKILTGRSTRFSNLRKMDGLSDTQKRAESLYDVYEACQNSSCSAALGFSISRDVLKEDYNVIAYIDSSSLQSGKTLEALMDIGNQNRDVIIIYNDNDHSKHSSLLNHEHTITSIRTSDMYQNMKNNFSKVSPKPLKNTLGKLKESIKENLLDAPLFKGFHIDYMGPINGHDIKDLIKSLKACKNHRGPVLLHIVTKNGNGYEYAMKDSSYDYVEPFNIDSGESLFKTSKYQATFNEIMDTCLTDLKSMDPNIIKIDTNPYMKSIFKEEYPSSYISMPNSYRHAISVACASSLGNVHPYISIPSNQINDSFHSICMEMAKMKCGVIVGIEDCGLLNQNKEHGIYDIGVLSNIPNLMICHPKNDVEAQNLLYSALIYSKPICIRTPSGLFNYTRLQQYKLIEAGSWEMVQVGNNPTCVIVTYGCDFDRICTKAKENEMSVYVVNARFLKPMDTNMLDTIKDMNLPVIVYEQDCMNLKSMICEYFNDCISGISISDHFVKEGPLRSLRIEENIHLENLFKEIQK